MNESLPLNQALGYGPDDKLLILNCTELGMSFSTTQATYEIIHSNPKITASLMMPCPFSRVAIEGYRGTNVGIRLVLTSPFSYYRWEPITNLRSLLDGDGGFPKTIFDFWEHADSDEAYKECSAQIEKAVVYGFDVTHVSDHCGVLNFRPELFSIYMDIASEYRLPISLANSDFESKVGFEFRKVAKNSGLVFPDHIIRADYDDNKLSSIVDLIPTLKPGVTECVLRPSADTPEIKSVADDNNIRVDDFEVFNNSSSLNQLLDSHDIKLITFDDLRQYLRSQD